MAGTYYPLKDAEFSIWLGNFVNVANGNLVALGLVATDIDPVKAQQTTYTANLADVETKKTALAASVETKDATKNSIIQKTRLLVNKIQANPAVTPALKAQLGISTRDGGQNPTHPIALTDLIANLKPDGSIELNWSRNGNAPGDQVGIECCEAGSKDWKLLNVITKTSYTHVGHPLGTAIKFTVKARRADETSGPSNIAVIE